MLPTLSIEVFQNPAKPWRSGTFQIHRFPFDIAWKAALMETCGTSVHPKTNFKGDLGQIFKDVGHNL